MQVSETVVTEQANPGDVAGARWTLNTWAVFAAGVGSGDLILATQSDTPSGPAVLVCEPLVGGS